MIFSLGLIRTHFTFSGNKVSRAEAAVFLVFMILAVWQLPWWGLIIPSVFFGFLKQPAKALYKYVTMAAGVVWLTPAFIQDAMSGFRTSSRVADVLRLGGLGWLAPVGVYGITLLIALLLALLSAIVGSSLRAAFLHSAAYLNLEVEKQED